MGVTPETLKIIGTMVVAVAMFVVLPLTIVFTEHQRKMMKLLRGQNDQEPSLLRALLTPQITDQGSIDGLRQRVDALEAEVAQLKSQSQPAADNLSSRIGSG